MELVQKLHGKTYRWKRKSPLDPVDASIPDPKTHKTIGFIAQEVQRIVPGLVQTDSSGFLSVAYAEFVPILVEAFKQHLEKFQEAKEELKTLEHQQLRRLDQISASLQDIYSRTILHSYPRLSNASDGSSDVELQILSENKDGSFHAVLKAKRTKAGLCGGDRCTLRMLIIAMVGVVLLAALITLLAVFVRQSVITANSPSAQSPTNQPGVRWSSPQTLRNATYEDPDPMNPRQAVGWTGYYSRTNVSNLPVAAKTTLFDQGNFVAYLDGGGQPSASPDYASCSQTVRLTQFLDPRSQGLAPDSVVWATVNGSVWTFVQPRNATLPGGALRILLRFYPKGSAEPISLLEAVRLPSDSPGAWQFLNVTNLELPLPASDIEFVDFVIISTIPQDSAISLVDYASMTFSFRAANPPTKIETQSDVVEPSPPIESTNVTVEGVISSMSIGSFWGCDTCNLSFSAFPDVHTAASSLPQFNLRAKNVLYYQLSYEKMYRIVGNFQADAPNVTVQFRLTKAYEWWTDEISETTNSSVFSMGPTCDLGAANVFRSCTWDLQLDQPLVGPSVDVFVTSSTTPFRLNMKDVFVKNLEASFSPPGPFSSLLVSSIPTQSSATVSQTNRLGCPHLRDGLIPIRSLLQSITASGTLTLPSQSQVLISSSSIPANLTLKELVVPRGTELIFDDAPILLRVGTIRNYGAVRIGSPSCRLFSKITVVFEIDKAFNNIDDTKGIITRDDAEIDIHGKQFVPTWTRLAQSAYPGADKVFLKDSVNWEVGQQVLVASSYAHDSAIDFNEVMTIQAIRGSLVQFTDKFRYYHHANLSTYQTEVALLSRRIVLKGDASSIPSRMSGYVMANGSNTQIRLSGVEFLRMGQYNSFQRDAVVLADVQSTPARSSFISDCSFDRPNYRCIAMCGVSGINITANVCVRPRNHGFMNMYGTEEDNFFVYNFVARPEFRGISRDVLALVTNFSALAWKTADSVLTDPSEPAASGFFISSPKNSYIGNAVSGGWSGFMFATFDRAVGPSASNSSIVPSSRPFGIFSGNTAHSTSPGPYTGAVHFGAAMTTIGGRLAFTPVQGLAAEFRSQQNCRISHTKVWLSGYGMLVSPYGCTVDRSEVWDSRAAFFVRGGTVSSSLIAFSNSAREPLPQEGPANFVSSYSGRYGVEILGGNADLFVYNTTCHQLRQVTNATGPAGGYCFLNRGRQIKPQFSAKSLRFNKVDPTLRYLAETEQSTIVDVDNSVSGIATPSIVGGSSEFWSPFPSCVKSNSSNGLWACPISPRRQPASIRLQFTPPNIPLFNVTLCNNGSSFGPSIAQDNILDVSGITGECWYISTSSGLVSDTITIQPRALRLGAPVVVVFSLPSNLLFVNVSMNGTSAAPSSSLAELNDAQTPGFNTTFSFFQTGQHLYVRVVDQTGEYPILSCPDDPRGFILQTIKAQLVQLDFACSGACSVTSSVPPSIAHLSAG